MEMERDSKMDNGVRIFFYVKVVLVIIGIIGIIYITYTSTTNEVQYEKEYELKCVGENMENINNKIALSTTRSVEVPCSIKKEQKINITDYNLNSSYTITCEIVGCNNYKIGGI